MEEQERREVKTFIDQKPLGTEGMHPKTEAAALSIMKASREYHISKGYKAEKNKFRKHLLKTVPKDIIEDSALREFAVSVFLEPKKKHENVLRTMGDYELVISFPYEPGEEPPAPKICYSQEIEETEEMRAARETEEKLTFVQIYEFIGQCQKEANTFGKERIRKLEEDREKIDKRLKAINERLKALVQETKELFSPDVFKTSINLLGIKSDDIGTWTRAEIDLYLEWFKNVEFPPENVKTKALQKEVETFKQSGHYVNEKLKHNHKAKDQAIQLSVWDALKPETQELYEEEKDSIQVEGIKLSVSEDATMNALLKVLNRKSQPGKYTGNLPSVKVSYGEQRVNSPQLSITLYELFKERFGDKIGGKQMDILKDSLTSLEEKKFLIKYVRPLENRNSEVVEIYEPLIKIFGHYKDVTPEQMKTGAYRNDKGIRIKLHPVVIDQINTNFIVYPADIDKRTMIAAESLNNRYPEAVIKLRDYLQRWIANNKGTKTEINEDTLHYQLGLEKYIKQSRKKLIKKNTEIALKSVIKLGMVTKYERVTGAKGQWKYVFHLNPKWF